MVLTNQTITVKVKLSMGEELLQDWRRNYSNSWCLQHRPKENFRFWKKQYASRSSSHLSPCLTGLTGRGRVTCWKKTYKSFWLGRELLPRGVSLKYCTEKWTSIKMMQVFYSGSNYFCKLVFRLSFFLTKIPDSDTLLCVVLLTFLCRTSY